MSDLGHVDTSDSESENGRKVSLGLIETILGQMKCEFNRSIVVNDEIKKQKLPKIGKGMVEETDVKNEMSETGKENEEKAIETECQETNKKEVEQECSSVTGLRLLEESCDKVEDGVAEVNVNPTEESRSAKTEKDTPNILLNLDCTKELLESNRKSKINKEVCDNDQTPIKVDVPVTDVQVVFKEVGKRSLRSQNVVKTPTDISMEPAGVKRSARRRSKDSPRESVLQSAIARKEKSFSNLTHSDEKSSSSRNLKVTTSRSLRITPAEKSHVAGSKAHQGNKSVGLKGKPQPAKSARLSSQAGHNSADATQAGNKSASSKTDSLVNASDDSQSKSVSKVSKDDSVTSSEGTENNKLNVESNIKSTARSQTPSNTTLTYTKTGKRRYKPFKGLRYSFTSGTKKTKIVRRRERSWSENARVDSIVEDKKVIPIKSELIIKIEDLDVGDMEMLPEESSTQLSSSSEVTVATLPLIVPKIESGVAGRSSSPVVADACQTATQKRKLQPGEEEEEVLEGKKGKRSRRVDIPSPSPAEDSPGPDKPESTAISSGAGTAALCSCQQQTNMVGTVMGAELYCQAFDSLDLRVIGCGNAIATQEVRIVRPSSTVPYLILCEEHHNRLLRHNCCPGCGIFCTQGEFLQCASLHVYHQACQMTVDDKAMCPHCGIDSPPFATMLTLGTHQNPVFLPQQKPPKKNPSAKMSFGNAVVKKEPVEAVCSPSPPLVPATALTLPTGREVSFEGLPASLDKDKLAHLLCVASSMRTACEPSSTLPRYTLKNMYQAAKMGNAEKLLSILASGLNPNHLFREYSMGTALHAACAGGHLVTVHILLQAGSQLDVMDREQNTPLMLATVAKHNDVVKYVIKAGANIILKGHDGMTALHLAAKAGNREACHYLLSTPNISSSYIDSVDDGGWTPLVWAAEHCHTLIARFLLEKRADPFICDVEQNIALHWSAFSGSVDISEMLLNYGCQVNCVNTHGDTPLHIGARQDMYNCVLLLLARGARVDLVNKHGDSPLGCCLSRSSECFTAIRLNMVLHSLMIKPRLKAPKILTNDISRGKEMNPIQCVNMEDEEGEPKDYTYVSENCFTSNIVVERTITSLQMCTCIDSCSTNGCLCANISIRCWYDDDGRLLPEFSYTDPPMLFECNQGCACNRVTCNNRVVQHGLTARFQLFRTCGKGWGVRTLRPIYKGSYVCEYIGEIISDHEADHREDDSYLFDLDNRDGETYCIDARHYGNIARFINHMCTPNLLPVRVYIDHQDLRFPRIAFFANRDIEAEEELGFDYGEKFWIIKCKSFTCTCGATNCRYSKVTIKQTLENYNKRLAEEAQ